jgi:hypothetical protein
MSRQIIKPTGPHGPASALPGRCPSSGTVICGASNRREPGFTGPFKFRTSAKICGYYRTSSPVTALPIITRWISDVPSKMVKILASLCHRSTG